MTTDLAAHARSILDTIGFMVLGTADADGRPWTSPVYFAADGLRQFYWLSATDSQHSVNVAARPQVSLVVFDSTVRPYHGSAVYAAGDAHELSGTDLDRALQVYPRPRRPRRVDDSPGRRHRLLAVPHVPGDGQRPVGAVPP